MQARGRFVEIVETVDNPPEQDLQREIQALGHVCHYFPSFDEIENFLLENCIKDDLLITMGAGDVVKIGESLLGS